MSKPPRNLPAPAGPPNPNAEPGIIQARQPKPVQSYSLAGAVDERTGFRNRKMDIPFYNAGDDSIKTKITYDKIIDDADLSSKSTAIGEILTDRLILHYYPEFYEYLPAPDFPGVVDLSADSYTAYEHVRTMFGDALTIGYYTPVDPLLVAAGKSVLIGNISSLEFPLDNNQVSALKNEVTAKDKISGKVEALESTSTSISVISPAEIREVLEILNVLPPFGDALRLFNQNEEISIYGDETTLPMITYLSNSLIVNDVLKAFAAQETLLGPNVLPVSIDFESVRTALPELLNSVILESILEELQGAKQTAGNPISEESTFLEFNATPEGPPTGVVFISFGMKTPAGYDSTTVSQPGEPQKSLAIAGISYFAIGDRLPLKTGYMTNSKYNHEFQDMNTLVILKSFNSLVTMHREDEAKRRGDEMAVNFFGALRSLYDGPSADWTDASGYSFTDWMSETNPADFGIENPDNWTIPDIPSPAELNINNEFIVAAAQMGLIDLADTEKLEKGFVASLSPEELRKYKAEVMENPEVYRKVMLANKKKSLKAGVQTAEAVASFFNGSIPGLKKGSKMDLLLKSIGMDALVKEALICATFGLMPALGRIATAVANAIKTAGQQIYIEPRPPGLGITIPAAPAFIKQLKAIFTIDGELWRMMLKVMLETLQSAVMEIVKGLAKLLKELCELKNPRAEDFGETDIADLINKNKIDYPDIVGPGPLETIAAKKGLTMEQMMKYFQHVSAILSSMEICFLFTNRSELTYETMSKILTFNLSYEDLQVRNALNSFGAIKGFFAELSRFVDATPFCNEIANEVYALNIDNICLLEEEAPDAINQILQDMVENGIVLENPLDSINLDCPLRDDYMSNPLVSDTIPGLLDFIMEVVEGEFANSLSSLTSIMKEPSLQSTPGGKAIQDAVAAGRDYENDTSESGWSDDISGVAKDVMKKVAKALKSVGDTMDEIDQCNLDLEGILGTEAETVDEVFTQVIGILTDLVNDPEMMGGINDIATALESMSDGTDENGNPSTPVVTYQFPPSFKRKFRSYLPNGGDFSSGHDNKFSAGSNLTSQASNGGVGMTFLLGEGANATPGTPRGMVWDRYQPGDAGYYRPVGSWPPNLSTYLAMSATARQAQNITRSDIAYQSKTAMTEFQNGGNPAPADQPHWDSALEEDPDSPCYGMPKMDPPCELAGQEWGGGLALDRLREIMEIPPASLTQAERDEFAALNRSRGRWYQQSAANMYLRPLRPEERDSLTINYPSYTTSPTDFVDIRLTSNLLAEEDIAVDYNDDAASIPTGYDDTRGVNPYVSLFSDSLRNQIEFVIHTADSMQTGQPVQTPVHPGTDLRDKMVREIENVLFPAAYAGLVESTFDYIQQNGIFTTEKLNSVQLFHDNANCLPADVADFLDADGILAQLQDEMLDALCYDPVTPGEMNPMGAKIRDVIKYGLFMLLIQIHIAQFVIKNIFVLSAFEIDQYMEKKAVKSLLAATIGNQMADLLSREPIVSQEMVKYFNKKIKRTSTIDAGGLKDRAGNIVFPAGTDFSIGSGGSPLSAIVAYLVKMRIYDSKTVVSNAMKKVTPDSTAKPLDRAFIEDVLTVQPMWLGGINLRDKIFFKSNIGPAARQIIVPTPLPDITVNVEHPLPPPSSATLTLPAVGAPVTTRTIKQQRDQLRAFSNRLRKGESNMNLGYGKLVLERWVTWDSLTPSPGASGGYTTKLNTLSGQDYGMEISLFQRLMGDADRGDNVTNAMIALGLNPLAIPNITFHGVGIKYKIVYYLPSNELRNPREIARKKRLTKEQWNRDFEEWLATIGTQGLNNMWNPPASGALSGPSPPPDPAAAEVFRRINLVGIDGVVAAWKMREEEGPPTEAQIIAAMAAGPEASQELLARAEAILTYEILGSTDLDPMTGTQPWRTAMADSLGVAVADIPSAFTGRASVWDIWKAHMDRAAGPIPFVFPGNFFGDGMFYDGLYDAANPGLRFKEENWFDLGTGNGTLYRFVLKDLDTRVSIGSNLKRTTESAIAQIAAYNSPTLTEIELVAITDDPVYQDFFGKAFSSDLITFIPVLYNFYLTSAQFPKVDGRFAAPKERCLQIFRDTVNSSDTVPKRSRRRGVPPQDMAGSADLLDKLGLSARDFVLKMLLETPIEILRGICELIDPHIALSKLVRDVTGEAFNQIGKAIDMSPALLPLTGPLPDPRPDAPEGSEILGIAPGLTGEGVIDILTCILSISLKKAVRRAPHPPGMDDIKLVPHIDYKGVDFKGTVPGIFMFFLSPFGFIYLLLMLLKRDVEDLLDMEDDEDDVIDVTEDEGAGSC